MEMLFEVLDFFETLLASGPKSISVYSDNHLYQSQGDEVIAGGRS